MQTDNSHVHPCSPALIPDVWIWYSIGQLCLSLLGPLKSQRAPHWTPELQSLHSALLVLSLLKWHHHSSCGQEMEHTLPTSAFSLSASSQLNTSSYQFTFLNISPFCLPNTSTLYLGYCYLSCGLMQKCPDGSSCVGSYFPSIYFSNHPVF